MEGVYVAEGYGGQRIMVFPQKNLVIGLRGKSYTSGEFIEDFYEVPELISGRYN